MWEPLPDETKQLESLREFIKVIKQSKPVIYLFLSTLN